MQLHTFPVQQRCDQPDLKEKDGELGVFDETGEGDRR